MATNWNCRKYPAGTWTIFWLRNSIIRVAIGHNELRQRFRNGAIPPRNSDALMGGELEGDQLLLLAKEGELAEVKVPPENEYRTGWQTTVEAPKTEGCG
jgi:hypothetical protein